MSFKIKRIVVHIYNKCFITFLHGRKTGVQFCIADKLNENKGKGSTKFITQKSPNVSPNLNSAISKVHYWPYYSHISITSVQLLRQNSITRWFSCAVIFTWQVSITRHSVGAIKISRHLVIKAQFKANWFDNRTEF